MPKFLPHIITALWLSLTALAPSLAAAVTPATADQVFVLTIARSAGGGLALDWDIAFGHYLYRDRIAANTALGQLVAVATPSGQMKNDPTFGSTAVYHDHLHGEIAHEDLPPIGQIVIVYQGCAERGICYPPISKTIDLSTMAVTSGGPQSAPSAPVARSKQTFVDLPAGAPTAIAEIPMRSPDATLLNANTLGMLAAFFGFGLLLAFTPCAFPMIPILSGMLARSGERLSPARGFGLSAAYVLAAALAYAALGVFAAWSGQNLQAALQTPIAVVAMSVVLIVLALSMFGLFELQVPASFAGRFAGWSASQSGSLGGAALLGFGSALIVGPCVTPPLAAALLYIGQTGNTLRGASALFALGLGMGMPLMAFGTFGAGLMPKSGPWLVRIKHVFGFAFIGMAIWMLSRITPGWLTLEFLGIWLINFGIYLGAVKILDTQFWKARRLAVQVPGAVVLLFGTALLIGSALGNDIFRAFPVLNSIVSSGEGAEPGFRTVTTPAAFDALLAVARDQDKPVVVDFWADWCIECKAIDRNVFSDPKVRDHLRDLVLIRADMTNYNDDSRRLMQRFNVVGPPTIVFMDPNSGIDHPDNRIVGETDVKNFLSKLSGLPRL
jgi:thiol:disulfide interchange protein DsbD